MDTVTILAIDDDRNILMLLSLYLNKEGYDVVCCEDGAAAVDMFTEKSPALVLLDVMLPGKDGLTVLSELRQLNGTVPIIMLTAKGTTDDKVAGLEKGADDYIVKPFDSKELVARINAALRRATAASDISNDSLSVKGLVISKTNYTVMADNVRLDMAPKEIELLYYLASHEGNVFTREQILNAVWDIEFYGDTRTVDVHVMRIREKLGERAAWIQTVWAVGYKFDSNAEK